MSYLFANSPLSFGINLWQVVKSTIARTQVKLEHSSKSKVGPSNIHIAKKSKPVIETSFICASSSQVQSCSCNPLATPFAFERSCPVIIDEAGSKEFPKVESLSEKEQESSSINNLFALDSLCESTFSNDTQDKASPEFLEVNPKLQSSSSKSNSSPSSFLAFLEASHLEMSERLRSQQPDSALLDLGCAQFNSAYYRRHPPPSLPQPKVNKPSKKSFCWKSKMDEIMRESGEECDETAAEISTEVDHGFLSSSPSHTRSSSISSDMTCVESPEILVISTPKELAQKPLAITITHSDTLLQPIVDVQPNLPSLSPTSPCTPSSFLEFLESSNLEMTARIQAEKSENSTLDLGCAQFNSAYYRRHPPPSLPVLKGNRLFKKPSCWKTKLDQMMRDEECENVSAEIVDELEIKLKSNISSSTSYTSSPRIRSTSCSSNATCVEKTPLLISLPKILLFF